MIDFLSLGFLLLILVASGGIAFVADGLGKKIGKKRLSLFGLRPRHVASLGTVLMGVMVSFLTIVFVASVSGDAREWLLQGRKLLAQRDDLQKGNKALVEENQKIEQDSLRLRELNRGIGRDNRSLGEANGRLRESLNLEKGKLDSERASLQSIRKERSRLNAQVVKLQGQVVLARRQFETTRHLLAQVKTNLDSAQRALQTAKSALAVATQSNQNYIKSSQAIMIKSQQTNVLNKTLEAEVAKRQKEVADLQTETEARKKELDDAVAQVDAAKASLASVQVDLNDARQAVKDLRDIADFLAGTTRASRTEPMIFQRGEELARVAVPAGSGSEATANALDSLIRAARARALAHGAKAHRANGETFDVADIVERKDPKTGMVADTEALKRALVGAAQGQPNDLVLVATSTLNAFVGESVSLDIAVLPNPLVYRRNEMVAEAQIDGAQSEERIFAQLSEFLGTRVPDRAAHDRMVLHMGPNAPFGDASAFEVLSLVRDVKQRGRSVRVQALAESDLHAADPLRLEYRVR